MLNPDLHLNPHIFDSNQELKAIRDGFGEGLVAVAEVERNVVVVSADLTISTRVENFRLKFPERFIECGVAEQNMAAISAGLAEYGKIPFMSSYSTFSPGKNWETIRTTIVYNNVPVKIAGHYTGVATGEDGATHQATEDIAITRVWPHINVICPCDAIETHKVTIASVYVNAPVYLRFSRHKAAVITTTKTPYDPLKSFVYWTSPKPQCTLFATGYMVYHSLVAAKELESEGVAVLVVNVANIKPLDKKTILESARIAGCAVSVEDHQIAGGLGSTLAELFAKELPTPMEFIGLQDTFAESGSFEELLKKYHMDTTSIKTAVKKAISRKTA